MFDHRSPPPYEVPLLLDIVASTTTSYQSSSTRPDKSDKFSLIRICINIVLVVILGASTYGCYWLIQKDRRREQQIKSFMQDASAQLGRSSAAYLLSQSKYLKLREEIFDQHNDESFSFPSIEDADAFVSSTDNLDGTWQRKLPYASKQKLKAGLVRLTIAVIPRLEEVEKEYNANAILYNQRLIADVHWHAVKSDYENICTELELIVRDANCIEEGWGLRPDGLFHTARSILLHEVMKEKSEQDKKKAEIEREKEAQRLERSKRAAEKEEREKQARQEKKAAEALESLLQEESSETSKKKENSNLVTRK